jgi:hypothetical protein
MRKLQKPLYCILCLTVLIAVSMPLTAAEENAAKPVKPAKLFTTQDALKVTLYAPWRDITRKKKKQDPYPATIEFTDELGNAVKLPLTVERRGITRQQACKFPPIKLRFDKQDVKGTTFRGQKSLKMVTHCQKASSYEHYYVLEYLAYRMYNQVTDMSFRVRPLDVVYVDSENNDRELSRFAFLIEDDSDVADRFDLKKLRIPKAKLSQLDSKTTAEFGLFQYMIANVDWSAILGPDPEQCCHNAKLIGPEPLQAGDTIYPLPYDFDSAGLVNAKYARPPEGLPIRQVTQRLYRGYCAKNDELETARNRFLEQEQAIYGLVSSEARLELKQRDDALDFLRDFFDIIRDDGSFRKQVIEKCRK